MEPLGTSLSLLPPSVSNTHKQTNKQTNKQTSKQTLSGHSLGASSSGISGQLPLLAALGLSALSNLRHFSSEQLSLLGINAGHLHGNGGGKMGGPPGAGVRGGSGLLGHRGQLQVSKQFLNPLSFSLKVWLPCLLYLNVDRKDC